MHTLEKQPEIFIPFKHNPKYLIGDQGTILSTYLNPKGQKVSGFTVNGIPKFVLKLTDKKYPSDARSFFLHRLIAEHHLDNPNNYQEVRILDKSNPITVNNIEWASHSQIIQNTTLASTGSTNPSFGRTHSEYTKRTLSTQKKGTKHPKFTGWYLHNGIRYTSATSASRISQTSRPTIKKWANNNLNGWSFERKSTPVSELNIIQESHNSQNSAELARYPNSPKLGEYANGVVYTIISPAESETQTPRPLSIPSPYPSLIP